MKHKDIPLRLWYTQSAPKINEFLPKRTDRKNAPHSWEKWSLPIGNGWMGVNVFGRTDEERLQVTENSLCNPSGGGGLNNFAEVMIRFGHENVEKYVRELSLDDACARVRYDYNGVTYERELFTSYPDRVMVMRMTASEKGALSFVLAPFIPYIKESEKGYSKRGTVEAKDNRITLKGEMEYYAIQFEGQFLVLSDGGERYTHDGEIEVKNANSAVIIMAVGTNYRLESRVFVENDPKKKLEGNPHPHDMVSRLIESASAMSYDELYRRHIADYKNLFDRVRFRLDTKGIDIPTDELLNRYREGEHLPYLEMLYYQFGRYLLISSSREGTLPANLQGVWNCYDEAPWGSGYWHNINVQMNYWPAFVANLAETFTAYADYAEAYMEQARKQADSFMEQLFPERMEEAGKNGWIIGTAAFPYQITNVLERKKGTQNPIQYTIGHSGPGTGAFTSILFWEWYEFTRDRKVLERAFDILKEMSYFLSKTLIEVDGKLLVNHSASPEQIVGGKWSDNVTYYHTVGCAFDQQMVYENHRDLIRAAKLLGREDDSVVQIAMAQIDKLDPVQVGISGQIKEYREEKAYGEIGEWGHRHISHLVGLYPGTLITTETPAWLDAARITLNLRGDRSTGWAMAHRLNSWARIQDGNRSHKLYRTLLSKGTYPNLWDAHPPFQIDGNFGGTSGVSEMLLQSHIGVIDVLPALPDVWADGSFSGLVARGNFVVDAQWKNGQVQEIRVTARMDGEMNIRCGKMKNPSLYDENGVLLATCDENGILRMNMHAGECVRMQE